MSFLSLSYCWFLYKEPAICKVTHMMLDKLKGKRFTRIKYGKQKWVKEISQAGYSSFSY